MRKLGHLPQFGRQRTRHAVAPHVEDAQVVKLPQLGGIPAPQGVVLDVEQRQAGEFADLGRDLAVEPVVLQVELPEIGEFTDGPGNLAMDAVVSEVEALQVRELADRLGKLPRQPVGRQFEPHHAPVAVGGDAVPPAERRPGAPEVVAAPVVPAGRSEQLLKRCTVRPFVAVFAGSSRNCELQGQREGQRDGCGLGRCAATGSGHGCVLASGKCGRADGRAEYNSASPTQRSPRPRGDDQCHESSRPCAVGSRRWITAGPRS